MLKVCFITPNLLPVPSVLGGAIENLVTNMVKEQEKKEKIEMTVVSIYNDLAYEESKKYSKTNFIYIKKDFKYMVLATSYHIANKLFKKDFNTYNQMVLSKIKYEDFDYIIAEGGHYTSYEKFLKYFPRNKLILHLHHQASSNPVIDKTFSKLISVSKFIASDFQKSTNKIDITYLNNGINIDNFNKEISVKEYKELRHKYEIKEKDFVVLYCGRLIKEKGVLELIKAVKEINNENIKLLILGSSSFSGGKKDDYILNLENQIKGHEDKIIFTGYINNWEVYKYYKIADMVCLPSMWEDAAPLTCIETMISKKVMLATNSGGITEYLDSKSSLIVKNDSNLVNHLKEGIISLYNSKDKLKGMGERAYKHALKFSSENYYLDFIKILENYER